MRHLMEVVAYGYDGQLYCVACAGSVKDREDSHPIFYINLDDMPEYPCAVCREVVE